MSERPRAGIEAECLLQEIEMSGVEETSAQVQAHNEKPEDESRILSLTSDHLSPEDLQRLGGSHYDKFLQYGNLDDIMKSIEYETRAVDLTASDHPSLPMWLNNLGSSHEARFQRLGELDDIENAIRFQTRAVDLAPSDHPNLTNWLSNLGSSYETRFGCLGKLDDVKMSIRLQIRAVDLTPDDHPDLPVNLNNLGMAYRGHFNRSGELDDIEKAIEYQTRAVGLAPSNHPNLQTLLNNLGLFYSDRFERVGKLDDIGSSIRYQTHAVNLAPKDHPNLPSWLSNLGASYWIRFNRLGELNDIEKAIQYKTRAVDSAPNRHSMLPLWLSNLGMSYGARFNRLGELEDVEKAILHQTRAVNLARSDHPSFPVWLNNLGSSLWTRFNRLGELDDIEKAILYKTRAVNLAPDSHPDLPLWLSNLGASHGTRFNRLGEFEDVEKAILHQTRAVKLAPSNHPTLSNWLSNLGMSYRIRSNRSGELDDIENAIQCNTRAVNLTPDNHPDLPIWLSNLGMSHGTRFDHLGELDDVEKDIRYHTRAVDLAPNSHPSLPMWLGNLGVSYWARFNRLDEPADFEKAIWYKGRAVDMAPNDHPYLPTWLNNLGSSYHTRFNLLGQPNDIEMAIQCQTRAVNLSPSDYPRLPNWLNNLGWSYHTRFDRLGELDDLQSALTHQSHALASTSDDQPILSFIYRSLATTGLHWFRQTGDLSHLQQSLDNFRRGSQVSMGLPRHKLQCALDWAKNALIYDSPDCMEAYQTTMDLLPRFIWLGTTIRQRYHNLTTASTLAINAAHAAVLHSNHTLALEWLEHARCVVWGQSLKLRSPLDRLHSSYPELAIRLQAVSKLLQYSGLDLPESHILSPDSDIQELTGQERRRLAQEYDSLLAKTRSLSGFEDFLQPMKMKGLTCAARSGPIVVINCHEHCCDAFIIFPERDGIKHVPLPEYNQEKARVARIRMEQSLRDKGIRERGVKAKHNDGFATTLPELWRHVVKPILDFLGFAKDTLTESLPHITWCPTGALTFLPLHAAGDYDQSRSCIFDYAISSYTPTLSALLASTPSTPTHVPQVLAIGQSNTPGRKPLPGTIKELGYVKEHTQNKIQYSEISGSHATVEAVLDAMERHDWVHLACHAHQNFKDPTESGFFLHDGTLNLTAINRRSFSNKGLAFLSACQTATGDETLPDEAIHLASGMLMAGYSSVIATMWSVMDDDAPFVADKVYAELMKDGKVGNGEAGRALHHAVAALRKKVGEKEFGRWVPYIHIGS